jgi:hypothetical protein
LAAADSKSGPKFQIQVLDYFNFGAWLLPVPAAGVCCVSLLCVAAAAGCCLSLLLLAAVCLCCLSLLLLAAVCLCCLSLMLLLELQKSIFLLKAFQNFDFSDGFWIWDPGWSSTNQFFLSKSILKIDFPDGFWI